MKSGEMEDKADEMLVESEATQKQGVCM